MPAQTITQHNTAKETPASAPFASNRKQITSALREVGTALWQLTLFNAIMDCLVVFAISFLVLSLLAFPWYASLLTLMIYGGIHTYRAVTGLRFNVVEDKVPSLREKLTTAADNLDKENEMTASLNDDVLKLMKEVKTSYFLSFGRLTRELALMAILSFLIIGTAAYNVKLYDYNNAVDSISNAVQSFKDYQLKPQEESIYKETNDSKDIFGNKSIAKLGTKQLDLQINPTMSDVDITKQRERKPQQFKDVPPKEISATTEKSYGDTIPKGYQKIVKSYFKEITKVQ